MPPNLFRWTNGTVRQIGVDSHPRIRGLTTRRSNPYLWGVCTVFVQDGNQRILCVDFDARRNNVQEWGEWVEMGFEHVTGGRHVWSRVDYTGDQPRLAGSSSPTSNPSWIQELFSSRYHWRPESTTAETQGRTHMGLIGMLPLILALAALSCHPVQVRAILQNCMQTRRWRCHGQQHGRKRSSLLRY